MDKVEVAYKRVNAIVQVAKIDPQMGIVLLGACANNALNYFVRVTPPELITDAIQYFDSIISQRASSVSLPKGQPNHSCPK